MFVQNKYHTWYFNIIRNAQNSERTKLKISDGNYEYFENHHIKPKSLYPEISKDKENLVLLTAKEHFICHLLLCKFTVSNAKYKMINALIKMVYCKSDNQIRYQSKSYSMIRKLIAEKNSARMKGVPKSDDWKRLMSSKMKGRKMNEEFSKKRSESNKISWANGKFKGRPKSEETRRKISETIKDMKTVWIKNPNSKECGYVPKEIADRMITEGWILGRYQKDAVYITTMLLNRFIIT